eukprot:15428301-Heterocapsa_arctica.AAC.1
MTCPPRRDTKTPPQGTRQKLSRGTSPCEPCAAGWPTRPCSHHAGARAGGQGRLAAAQSSCSID